MSGIILVASIIIWSLSYFPTSLQTKYLSEQIQQIEKTAKTNDEINKVKHLKETLYQYRLEYSYLAQMGKAIEPIMLPLGFDWKITVSLLAGISGKEVVVSTLSVLYNNQENDFQVLGKQLKKATNKYGEPLFTLPVIIAFLTFVLIYFPCVAVIASIKKETARWKWALYVIIFSTTLAWLFSFIVKSILTWIL